MQTTRILATLVTLAGVVAALPAHAGERYAFPSPNGLHVSAAPAPSFVQLPAQAGSFVSGLPAQHHRQADIAPPIPLFRYGGSEPYRSLSHALTGAAYANYAADYARIFAPSYAVSSWTGRVFGVVEQGHGAVDAWTGAAYHLNRLRGRRGPSARDLSAMPQFRPHPELEEGPSFLRE
jgi:hypothetical protein